MGTPFNNCRFGEADDAAAEIEASSECQLTRSVEQRLELVEQALVNALRRIETLQSDLIRRPR